MLKIENLNKTYPGNIKALINVSISIRKGIFGLIGPNGSGKSSLMRTIATLQEPDTGSIEFDDLNVLKQKHEMRKVLGYLPQEFGVYPTVTAENLMHHLAVLKGVVDRKQREEHVSYLLELTNLSAHRKKRLGGFSGGMKQRFGIAQALLGKPRIIILDEPTAGLDPHERNRFHNLLSELGENITIILSTHIIADVKELCNNMAIIKKGKIVFQTTPNRAVDSFENKIWSKVVSRSEAQLFSEKFNVISSRLQYGQILLKILSDDQPPGFDHVNPNLEDVYFSYMGVGKETAQR
ncbi:MAG: putative ABC transporter ATP-binding protein YxlF [Chlamydiae bacterium]|nr:putative ABC transporter ATP-binding protein YxlF [Chlamydiota bacterium]